MSTDARVLASTGSASLLEGVDIALCWRLEQ
jgi:hypothetical protein